MSRLLCGVFALCLCLALFAGTSPMIIQQRTFEVNEDGSMKIQISSFQVGECDEEHIDTFTFPPSVTTYCDKIIVRPVPLVDDVFKDGFE